MFKFRVSLPLKLFFWRGLQGVSQQFFQFVFSIILARLLCPEVFGEIGMLMVFIYVGNILSSSGFSSALMQKRNVLNIHYTSVFVFSFFLSIILYLCIYLCSPLIGGFYNNSNLTFIVKVLALDLILSSFAIVGFTKLRREFKQREIATINIISLLVSYFIGILMAYLSFGIWSLVLQRLSNIFIQDLFYFFINKELYRFKFKFLALSAMYKFSIMLLLTSIVNKIFQNIYSIVLGKYFSAETVGYLNRAKSLNDLPATNFTVMIGESQIAILYRKQDDEATLVKSISRLIQISVFVIYPISAVLFAFAPQIILLLLGNQWLPAADFLKILCISCIFQPLIYFNTAICKVKGKTDCIFKATLVSNILIVGSILLLFKYGVIPLLLGQAVCNLISFMIYSFYSGQLMKYGFFKQLNNIKEFLLSALVMIFLAQKIDALLSFSSVFNQLIVLIPLAVIIYLLLIFILKAKMLKNIIKNKNLNILHSKCD